MPKVSVDLLLSGDYLMTMDAARTVVRDGAVAVSGGDIVEVGPRAAILERYEPAESIAGAIVLPGLVNAHTHLATALFKGLAEDMPLGPWLEVVWGVERAFVSPKAVEVSAGLAIAESIMGGVTCAVDMYWFPEAAAETARRLGFRLAAGPVFIGGDSPPDGIGPARRERFAREFAERYRGDPLITPMLMPHGPHTDTPESLAKVRRLADELGLAINIHVAETAAERADVIKRSGKTPVAFLESLGYLDGRSVFAHCVHVDSDDMALMAGRVSAAHNPMSNLKLASGVAPVAAMAKAGVDVALGTDGSMSGNDLDMWLAMRLAAVLQKREAGDTTVMKAEDVVAMATIGGARAAGLADRIGSIEVGKAADAIVIRSGAAHLSPLYDPYAHLVYAVGREDVSAAVIGGRVVMRDGRLASASLDGIVAAAEALSKPIGEAAAAARRSGDPGIGSGTTAKERE